MSEQDKAAIERASLDTIESIKVECVVGGVLQSITFKAGTNPAFIGETLKLLDPNCKVRDDFPARGSWGGGNRETKTARVLSISARNTASGKFIELGCITIEDGKEKDVAIAVGKDDSEGFLAAVIAVGTLNETQAEELTKALTSANGKANINLRKAENQFGAEYYTAKNGSAYLAKMKAEAPEIE